MIARMPNKKKIELEKITAIILSTVPAEMIILFGSYARGDWVEDKYDDEHFRYQSDFDLLVVVDSAKSEEKQLRYEYEIEGLILQEDSINTPVTILVHDIKFVNRRLAKGQYFFSDIKKDGITLYDSQKFTLHDAKELLPTEQKKLASEYFDYWFNSATHLLDSFEILAGKGSLPIQAFLLHQAAEKFYSTLLLVFTRYKPNTHDLFALKKRAQLIDPIISTIFSTKTPEDKRLFTLLRKAYVDARYKPSYVITQEELAILSQKVVMLQAAVKNLCQDKIDSFVVEDNVAI